MQYNKNDRFDNKKVIEVTEINEPTIAIYKNQEFKIIEQNEDEILLESLDKNNHFLQWYKINIVTIQK